MNMMRKNKLQYLLRTLVSHVLKYTLLAFHWIDGFIATSTQANSRLAVFLRSTTTLCSLLTMAVGQDFQLQGHRSIDYLALQDFEALDST